MARERKSPAMPFYGKDAYDDEAFGVASFAVQGLFFWLAWWQWREGSVPADLESILDKAPRAKVAEARRLWPETKRFFPTFGDGKRRRNETLNGYREEMLTEREKKQVGAEITNAKRIGKRTGERTAEHDAERTAIRTIERTATHVMRDASRDASAIAVDSSSQESEPLVPLPADSSRVLTPQQATVKQVFDALETHTTSFLLPTGGLVARWIRDFGLDATLATIVEEGQRGNLDGRDPSYLFKCIESRKRRPQGRTNGNGKPAPLPGVSVGANAPASPKLAAILTAIDSAMVSVGPRPSPARPEARATWDAIFAGNFGFTPDEWNACFEDDAILDAWHADLQKRGVL